LVDPPKSGRNGDMDLAGSAYLFALGTISTTFVGFSALIMIFRQSAGGALSPLDSWITLVFIQLGFIVTAASLAPPLLALCGMPEHWVWRLCSGATALIVAGFSASYPRRRRTVSGAAAPYFVWVDLVLLTLCIAVLVANAIGAPVRPGPGGFALALTGVLFVAGLGYLQALGTLHQETRRAAQSLKEL
jgi:hypothetical protein